MGTLAALLLFLLPGLLLVRREEWARGEPIELAGVAFAGSAAIWSVGFWALRFLPFSWKAAGLVAVPLVAAFVLVRHGAVRAAAAAWRRNRWSSLGQAIFLGAVCALRLFFAVTHVGYSGGDMTAHAAMAEEIVLADGFPQTQEPLLPIARFGAVAPGFHALAALDSLWSGAPTYRSTIYILCLALAGMSFALYALLRALSFSPLAAAAASAGALFLPRNPQFFEQWGGAPSILAAMIGLLLLRDLLAFGKDADLGLALRAGVLAAGVVTVHVLPAVGLLAIGPCLVLLPKARDGATWRRGLRDALVAGATALVLVLPFLLIGLKTPVPGMASWTREWFAAETRGAAHLAARFAPWLGPRPGAALWPFFLISYLGALPALALALGLPFSVLGPRRKAGAAALLILGVEALLFAAALTEALPGWPALYPTRIGLWLVVPLGIVAAELVTRAAHAPRSIAGSALFLFAAAFAAEGVRLSAVRFGTAFYGEARDGRVSVGALLVNEAAGGAFWVATFCSDVAAVTREDIAALVWAGAHTPPDAVFANNPGDGGALLPALAHRKILEPHYYWFFDRDEFTAWRARTQAGYVFVGARPAPAWGRQWTGEMLDRDARYRLVARFGEARVYQIAAAAAGA
ncbi:MAG TPA: hypothetical protein VKJ00_01305, partial [Thermoanaerobaculia bacterium]|nr:hypothetical protein [Thermoanaerobaculia bacterium]